MGQQNQQLKKHAHAIFQAGVDSVLPENCIPELIQLKENLLQVNGDSYDVSSYRKIFVISFGKAANKMFNALHTILDTLIHEAIVITNTPQDNQSKQEHQRIRYYEGTHPLPSEQNIEAAEHVISLCKKVQKDDLVIFLISGGGSSLLFAPNTTIHLKDYRILVDDLMKNGANINELNTVRIALSRVKGGQLLKYIHEATVVNIIISDVIGDQPQYIASGPTVLSDFESFGQLTRLAKSTLEKYGLYRKNLHWLSPTFDNTKTDFENLIEPMNYFAGSNRLALLAAKKKAKRLGYTPILLSTMIEGESREIGHLLGSILLEVLESGNPAEPPVCLLTGGETTVTVTGDGLGGRNQELVLGAAEILRDAGGGLLLSAGTDGIDGPTDAAGAVVDFTTAFRAVHEGLSIQDSLHQNDSYHLFKALDDLVMTGPTGTNVMDIQIGLIGRAF